MAEHTEKQKVCPHCGAALPEEAAFCPYCAQTVNRRSHLKAPAEGWRRALRRALMVLMPLLLVGGIAAGYHLTRPQTYEGVGEVYYSDLSGTYHLFLSESASLQEPVQEMRQNAAIGEAYRVPVLLRVYDADTGADAGAAFLEKTDRVTAEFPTIEGGGAKFACTAPAPHSAFPDVPLVSLVDYTLEADAEAAAEMVWTIDMKNGDTIRLGVDYILSPLPNENYYPEDVPMGTTEELQALIDEIAAAADPSPNVNIYLPPVTYDGTLVLHGRAINLYGSTGGEGRTVFTGSIRVEAREDGRISYFQDIEFRGNGGVALSAAANARATNCLFTGWDTGLYGCGTAWINSIGCTFADNGVGLHFNSKEGSANHSLYNDNTFRDNGTAVVLEQVPTDLALNFIGSVFEGNGTDIDNRCGQPLDLSRAEFR